MRPRLANDIFHCPSCGFWSSSFARSTDGAQDSTALVESSRRKALESLRRANFRRILDVMGSLVELEGLAICDIGCAHGWFLQAAQQRGAEAVGIEPDGPVAASALREGLNIRIGSFPDCLNPAERFGAIVFNDVLEHLSEPGRVISTSYDHLDPGGLLIVNCPSSGGAIFRLSCIAARLGMHAPFHRMWQRHFHCPHVSYFSGSNLEKLVTSCGFSLVHSESLPALRLRGLWNRLRMDREASTLRSLMVYLALVGGYPVLACLPSDILLHIYRK